MFDGSPEVVADLSIVLCSDECQAPADVINAVVATYPSFGSTEECEISIAIEGGIEAYMYRTTAATADEQQECWDATAKSAAPAKYAPTPFSS